MLFRPLGGNGQAHGVSYREIGFDNCNAVKNTLSKNGKLFAQPFISIYFRVNEYISVVMENMC